MPTSFSSNPLFGIALTLGAYVAAQELHRRYLWMHPFILTILLLAAALAPLQVPVADYMAGGDRITFFLGPATVALAVPLYRNARQIRAHFRPIALALLVGSITVMAAGGLAVWVLHGTPDIFRVMLPKSVTTPIAVELVAQFPHPRDLRALQELEATLVVLTGLFGAIIGPAYLRWIGVTRDIPIGLAVGTTAHGMGTASLVRRHELQASASGLAMALNGILTSLLLIPVYPWIP